MRVSRTSALFVTVLFGVFALAFVVETGALIAEFGGTGILMPVMLADAQNFVFFPLAGLAVLLAFWKPAVVATDAYWQGHVPGGRVLFVLGLIVLLLGSAALSLQFARSASHSPFEIAPDALMTDEGSVSRSPVMQALRETALQSRRPEQLNEHLFSCQEDILRFQPHAEEVQYCLAAGEPLSRRACCEARAAMSQTLARLYDEAPSDTSKVHRLTQPLKVTFMLTLLGIGTMLARRRSRLVQHYGQEVDGFAVPVMLGAGLMMVWPLMNASFNQVSTVMVGDADGSLYRMMEQIIGILFVFWALALIIFAVRSFPRFQEVAGQLSGAILAALGISQYQGLVGYVNRVIGIGADLGSLAVFAVVVVGVVYLMHIDIDNDPSTPM